MAPTSWRGRRTLLALSWVWASQAAGAALDEVALIQRDTHLQPDADRAGPTKDTEKPAAVITLSQNRRKNAITLMRAEVDKYMGGQNMGQLGASDEPDNLNALDPAQLMEMLPSLMDALRDDNFIRSFIQFEDGVEKASQRVVRSAHLHLEKFLRASNETTALRRSDTSSALRLSFARFLDHWVHQVLTSYTEELTEYAQVFKDQVGGDHQLSKGFADIFVPLFRNVTGKLSKKMIAGAGNTSDAMSFEEVFSNDDDAHFCGLAGEIVQNASKSSSEAQHVLKMLNATRRSAVPMLGKYLMESLPLDATEEDKKVPERMMLVTDYEVTAIYAGLNSLRETMGEYAVGLAPLLREHMQCETGAASSLYGLPRLAVLLALALAARFGL